MGEGLSPFPYMLIFPQDEHERLLIGRLAEVGVTVERPVELTTFADEGDRVLAPTQARQRRGGNLPSGLHRRLRRCSLDGSRGDGHRFPWRHL